MTLPLAWTQPKIDYNNFIFSFDYRLKNNYHETPLEAAVKTVNYIVSNYPSPYVLYLSGGIDSQAMLYAWHLSKVPFSTFSAKFCQDLNIHDLETIGFFGNKLGIKINFIPFDILNFLENEHDFYAKTYYTGSPQLTTFMKIVSMQEQGTAIMSGDFLIPRTHYNFLKDYKKSNITSFKNCPCKNAMGLFHYAYKNKVNFVHYFFQETEMLAHSFYRNYNEKIDEIYQEAKEIIDSGAKLDQNEIGHYIYKVALYQQQGFPVIPQTNPLRGKYNGFEKVKNYFDIQLEQTMSQLKNDELVKFTNDYKKLLAMRTSNQFSKRYFDVKYRNKYETFLNKIFYNQRTV